MTGTSDTELSALFKGTKYTAAHHNSTTDYPEEYANWQLEEAADWAKRFEFTTSEKADLSMKGYFTAATIGCWVSGWVIPGLSLLPITFYILGPIWNGVDSVGGAIVGKDDFKKSEDDKVQQAITATNTAIAGGIMPGCSIWALTEVGIRLSSGTAHFQPASSIAATGGALGLSLAFSGFSFSLAMAGCAVQSWYEYSKMDSPAEKIIKAINKNISIGQSLDQLDDNTNAMLAYLANKGLLQTGEGQNPDSDAQKVLNHLTRLAEGNTWVDFQGIYNQLQIKEDHKDKILAKGKFLIEKYNDEKFQKGLDATAWTFAAIGSSLVTASLFCPPLVVAGVALLTVAASIKAYQFSKKVFFEKANKHQIHSIYINHKNKIAFSGSETSDAKIKKIENHIIEAYLKRKYTDKGENAPNIDDLDEDDRRLMISKQAKFENPSALGQVKWAARDLIRKFNPCFFNSEGDGPSNPSSIESSPGA